MRREQPDVRSLLAVLDRFGVEYVVTGSVAALLLGVTVEPGDLDVTPACDRANLERLAQALADLEARQYPDEPFGRWTTEASGERRWVTFEPTEADRQARATWQPDPGNVDSFDHLLWTRLGTLDVVPEIAGRYEDLRGRAQAVTDNGRTLLVESITDQLVTLTVPRREKDRDRVTALRQIQRAKSRGATHPARGRSFGIAADEYARSRPSYPEAALRFVLPRVPCSVCDVGAGTGKLTEVLLRLDCDVVAVEPDDEMRARIIGAEARAGSAEALPLADGSVDAVVAGQAFHWFEVTPFLDETVRVLRPGGTLGLLWNQRDDHVDWIAEFAALAEFPEPGAIASADLGSPSNDKRFEPGELLEVPHAQLMDVPLLLDRVASSSYTIAKPPAERTALLARVERFARDRFGENTFEFPYLTRTWRYRLRSMLDSR